MLIDSHIHFDDARFDADRDALYQAALKVGIDTLIMPATCAAEWRKTRAIAQQYPHVYAAYGLHPYFIDQHRDEDLDQLKQITAEESPIAIGECGLDYFIKQLDPKKQQHFFEAQIAIAKEFDLPLIIHARAAVEAVIQTIKQAGHHKGMIHSFNGSLQQAQQLIDLGYLLSFGGAASYDRANKIRRLIRELPLTSLLIETDAPDQPPASHVGQRNRPALLLEVFETVVELRTEDRQELADQLRQNSIRLFDLYQDPSDR